MLKKLNQFNPKLITEKFFPWCAPEEINYGRCFQWAFYSHRLYPQDTEIWCTDCHACIRYQNEFYDSECVEGQTDCFWLPANSRNTWVRTTPHPHTLEDFKQKWNTQPARFHTTWELMDQLVERVRLEIF